ncbi:hypothetical protein BDN71DRAFT_1454589, partial [Pleurotus eryngii]
MDTLLVDSAVCPTTVRRYSCMGAYAEAERAQFNIIICAGYSLIWQSDAACNAFGEAREVMTSSCVCKTRAEGEGPRGTAGWLSCK